MTQIVCVNCKKEYPQDRVPFLCHCGGVYDFSEFPVYRSNEIDHKLEGMQKFHKLFGIGDHLEMVSLGEGNTPLLAINESNKEIFLKMESMNPTGSYKDRGTSVLVSFLRKRGVTFAVEDSSGNAGASFAAYCARAGIKARIYVPESTSAPKRNQIEVYGAELICIKGPRSEAAKAVLSAAENGSVYASHGFLPFGLTGIATIAYEIVDQLGDVPSSIIAPVGHGGLLYGLMLGFQSMFEAGIISSEPYYIGVQASGCSPIADAFSRNSSEILDPVLTETVAEGVKVSQPVRGSAILKKIQYGKGKIISIPENEILSAWQELARKGIYVEPTSALVWAAQKNLSGELRGPAVAVITGSGYKSDIHQK